MERNIIEMFDKYKNSNGTYNGASMLSDMTGIDKSEISWTFNRLKHLMYNENMDREKALDIVREECKTKPWIMNE